MEEFINWLNNLELQTLTDELKGEILEKVEMIQEDAYALGINEVRNNMLDYLESL